MTLFFLSGLAATQLLAQTCTPCPPCPPGCCAQVCDAHGKACKMDKKAVKMAAAQCTPEQLEACKAACKAGKSASSTDTTPEAVLADMSVAPVNATPKNCQPACCDTKSSKRKATRQTALAQQ